MKTLTIGKVGTKGSKKIVVDPDGFLKLAGVPAAPVGQMLRCVDKGMARLIRKTLHNNGFRAFAAIARKAA